MSMALYCLVAFAGTLLLVLILRTRRHTATRMMPPGPPGDPLVGHLFRMPPTDSALVFHEWAKIYGDVMGLEILGQKMIILDSFQAAVDLLDKRGAIYSDRPRFTLYKLLGWEPTLTFLPYGKQFNTHRSMHQSYLGRHQVEVFKLIQTQEARTLVQRLIDSTPDKYEKCMGRTATGVITQVTAGHQLVSDDDPYLHMSHMIVEAMSQTGPPGSSPLDFFPIIQHFPYCPGANHVGKLRPILRELHEYSLRAVKKQQETGEAMPSFILAQLEMGQSEEEDIKGAAVAMFGAGEATTWGALAIFVLAMILHPECQAKAQEEIDCVVGDQRLPDFVDRGNLPFVECVLQETFRWNSGVPLGVPHRVTEDDIYRGMFIPKGSLVFSNIKGMSLDENVYSDPTSFYPERFLPKPAGRGEPYFNTAVFGFGRRICTGQYLAESSLWIAAATILASCKIANAVDEKGNIIVPDSKLTDGLVSHPKDTRCVISARSPSAKALVTESLL
ncbi:cytochrome P450 [Mycena polygramma]|nr:cytochrome P450 [Mycena polygramma]